MSNADNSLANELRASAERFVADKSDHARNRALRKSLPGHDAALWDEIVAMGWLGIVVPEADGGIGLGLPEMAAIVGSLEKGLLSGPLIELAVLGPRALVHAPTGDMRSTLLSGVGDGSVRIALAMGSNGALPVVTGDEGTHISGQCAEVAGGAAATHFLIPAKIGDVLRLVAVSADAPGLSLAPHWRADGTPLAALSLDGVVIDDAMLIARGADAHAAIARALDETRIVAAAGLTGLSEHMLAMTIDYIKVRQQFDAVIGSFQAIQHKSVDLYIQKELAIATLGQALGADAGDAAALSLAAIRAKGRASAAAMRIGREAIQLHGAIGFTEEHDLGLFVKRAMVLSAWLGNATVQRRRYIEKGQVFA
ncbi:MULTISPECIES: acyl-CoA dehydrogenase family protein [unclassified Sphingobium]|uniref:acyl-CoA dehydrogenase family protein n=1 Tax=unclassified Sphingobium TaxID=2611147 RepID=UPI000D15A955|nr:MULTISPECIES: acyl-CoA dehydrogenase family protein [unclassified Sphingobium]MBG6120020.1 alkylation response protein AidB-like acyl-CoA dehydrogenase [Sphingobium sp. JAI105]PSO12923.1 acyl-CoA dehydrogenase [Sphingobium sp. AEW4]TWD05779.1 alkylation response protein AidB-like acyl-CoA dehydrogenase [Sphingobium sp. AEW010]TWD23332.1 alkylation response protein AidB-like acyl-CoA dehydrogenase [Sphingobium sp. AEW013]TWD25192.1 alkylation response protein AidB-like acyl-CoA dehydrogenase